MRAPIRRRAASGAAGRIDGPQRRRRPGVPVSVAVLVAVLAAAGVLVVRDRHSTPVGSPVRTAPAADPAVTGRAAALWASFPVTAAPRPVVLIGPDVDNPATGFADADDKMAYSQGRFELATTIPSGPDLSHGYPILSAAAALTALKVGSTRQHLTDTTLRIVGIALTGHAFATDRGPQELPAWAIRFAGVTDPAFVLAVADSARFNPRPGTGYGPPATVSRDGTAITFAFSAHVKAGPCTGSSTSTLHVDETATVVVLAVTTTDGPPLALPSGTACGGVGVVRVGPFRPGQSATRTVTLAAPLGARAVVDAEGNPFSATTA